MSDNPQSKLLIGVRLPATKPVRDVVATVRRAEDAGFDSAWFPDSHLNYREVWSTLGAVAISTSRISIGPTVTNLIGRHPTITASAARSIAEMAEGRFLLGVGSGDSALGFDDLRPSTWRELGAGVETLRTLLRGGHVRYGTFDASLRGPAVPVPIYVAASGPKTMKMAAAVGDAVIVTLGDIEAKLTTIREAAKDAGVEVPKVFVYTTCAVTDDLERTSRLFKPSCIRVAQLEGVAMFERAGVRVTPPAHVAGAEGDVGHAEDIAAAAQSLDSLVSDEAAVWFAQNRAIVGDAAEVHERFAWLQHVGVAGVTLNQLTGSDLPDALIDAVGPIIRSG